MTNKELIEKLQNNKELPVIFMVEDDVVAGDEYAYWGAQFDKIEVTKIYCYTDEYSDVAYLLYDEYNKPEWMLYDIMEEILGCDEADKLSSEELLKAYEELPWKDVIVIYVGGLVEWEI